MMKTKINNMKNVLMLFLLLFSVTISDAVAQSDKEARQLLENVINKMASYKNFKADLSYTMVNVEMDINEKKTGVIYVQGDSYRIEMEGQIIISDGKTIWTYILDSGEVMISNMEDSDESISPNKILTTYNQDYKAKFDQDKKYKNSELKMIDLQPKDKKQFEKMSLLVNQKKMTIENFSVYDKNGN
ncbi:MAG TPA: outer membrane lipoprotein carrier protein LolA, partial [Bacteroidetes bacterium]|nr:outer membrane lipoprotein carrier protein LolA [Bacteroidota bacterium]